MKIKGGDISLCFINRDGARWLSHSLSPLVPLVGEVVFVDTGSRDGSIEFAGNCGARVFEITWPDDFSHARNVYLKLARRPWILALDVDEVLFPGDLAILLETLTLSRESGVWFTVYHYCDDNGRASWTYSPSPPELPISTKGFAKTRNVKLFPNLPGLSYRYPVHESILPHLLEREIPMVDSPVPIHHLGLANLDESARKARVKRNMQLGMKKIEQYLDDAVGYLELAELILEYGRPEKAIRLLQQAVRLAPGYFNGSFRLAEAYEKAGQVEEAQKIYSALEEARPGDPLLSAALGRIAYEKKDFERAEKHLTRASDYLSFAHLAFARLHQNKLESAMQAARKAVELNPEGYEGRISLLRIQAAMQDEGFSEAGS